MRWVTLALGLAACGGPEATCDEDGPVVAWENFGDGFFTGYCQGCHASTSTDRFGAPASITFDDEAQVLALRDEVAREVLDEGSMPPGGGVPDDDLDALRRYLDCAGEL